MKQQVAARMCRAAIVKAIAEFYACELHMTAVDELATGFRSIGDMLKFLWNTENTERFGSFFYQMMHEWSSPRKNAALMTLTGKTRNEWLALIEDNKYA